MATYSALGAMLARLRVADPIESPEIARQIADEVERLIPPGVVYMPVPRCDMCRWWGRDGNGAPWGHEDGRPDGPPTSTCEHDRALLRYGGNERGLLWTSAHFGCVQFERKDGVWAS